MGCESGNGRSAFFGRRLTQVVSCHKRVTLPGEALTENYVALFGVVHDALYLSFDLLIIQVIDVAPGALRIFTDKFTLCFPYRHARRSIQSIVPDAADDDVHVRALQVAA